MHSYKGNLEISQHIETVHQDGNRISTAHFAANSVSASPTFSYQQCIHVDDGANAGVMDHNDCRNNKKVVCENRCGESSEGRFFSYSHIYQHQTNIR